MTLLYNAKYMCAWMEKGYLCTLLKDKCVFFVSSQVPKIVFDAISDSCKDFMFSFLPYLIIYCVHILLHAL